MRTILISHQWGSFYYDTNKGPFKYVLFWHKWSPFYYDTNECPLLLVARGALCFTKTLMRTLLILVTLRDLWFTKTPNECPFIMYKIMFTTQYLVFRMHGKKWLNENSECRMWVKQSLLATARCVFEEIWCIILMSLC